MGEIFSQEALLKKREQWRQEGKAVVFTNGCFDLLHVGHVRSIEEAAVLGDVFVVGLNSDQSVRQLKGEGRPLLDEKNRGEVVAALRAVDAVVFFDEPSADALLEKLKPDIHAKGTDYTLESVPERETVLRYGGRIAITGDPKNHSTKNLIKEIQTRYSGGK